VIKVILIKVIIKKVNIIVLKNEIDQLFWVKFLL